MTLSHLDATSLPDGEERDSPSALRGFAGLPEGPLLTTGDDAGRAGSRLARHPRLATRSGPGPEHVVGMLEECQGMLSALGIAFDVVRHRNGCVVIRATPMSGTQGRAACHLSKGLLHGLLEVNREVYGSVLETTCVERGAKFCLYTLLWNQIAPTLSPRTDGAPLPSGPPRHWSLQPKHPMAAPEPKIGSGASIDGGPRPTPRLRRLWRHGWILLVTTLAGILGGWMVARHVPLSYVAQATLVVQSGATGSGPGSANEAGTLATTYAAMIPTDQAVLSSAGTQLGVTPATVSHSLSISVKTGTSVLLLKYSAGTPAKAVRGASAVAEIVGGSASASRAIPVGSIVVIHRAATASRSHSLRRHGVPVGAVLGLMLGIMLVFAAERADPRGYGRYQDHEQEGSVGRLEPGNTQSDPAARE